MLFRICLDSGSIFLGSSTGNDVVSRRRCFFNGKFALSNESLDQWENQGVMATLYEWIYEVTIPEELLIL